MIKRYLKQLFTSLFASQTNEIRAKENEIDRQVEKIEEMQHHSNKNIINSK